MTKMCGLSDEVVGERGNQRGVSAMAILLRKLISFYSSFQGVVGSISSATQAVVGSIVWCPGSSRMYRVSVLEGQKAKGVGRTAPAATRSIAYAPNLFLSLF